MKDIIERKSEKPITVQGKQKTRYAFLLKNCGEWISTLDDTLGQSLAEGDEAEFETYEKGGFINLKAAEVIVSGDKPAETGIKTESAQKSPPRQTKRWHAYEDKEYQQAKDELIVRQMSYKAAVESFSPFEPGAVGHDKLQEYTDSLETVAHAIYADIIGGKW